MKFGRRDLLFWGVLLVAGSSVVGVHLRRPARGAVPRPLPASLRHADDLPAAVAALDQAIARTWDDQKVVPTGPADDLTYLRRLNLALAGAIPSLEEIRRFEALPAADRRRTWLDRLLADRRASDYLAERLARAFVGTEDGPFLLFRRRRFTTWLSDALHENRPYDEVVRDLIAGTGLWTDHPATNFLTVTFDAERQRPDPERLAARVARAFLGVRLDCAQCHDHPFAPWKQGDFRGLAAYFGGVHANLRGLRDAAIDYQPPDRKTKEPTAVEPHVPFLSELQPIDGTPRQRLAAWVTDPHNPSLARATANRLWALLLGRPLVEPIDDLPAEEDLPPALIALADDFTAHGDDVHRLIRLIAASRPFNLDSAAAEPADAWSAFPLTQLRPEQVAASIYQSATLGTIAADSPWPVRLFAYTGRNDFVRRYGDTGEDEFNARSGTIPQRLLLLNGDLIHERTKDDLFNASSRIAGQAPDDARAVEVAYLTTLTRRPTADEAAHFVERLKGTSGQARKEAVTDLLWTLLNSTEFSWNH